jgi:hypothetical protein
MAICVSACLIVVPLAPGVAAACEGGGEETSIGFLKFEASGTLKIPEGKTNSYNILYTEIAGPSGALSVKSTGPFSIPGTTCGKTLKGGEKCVVEIHCTGKAKEVGTVTVHTAEKGVGDAKANTECV